MGEDAETSGLSEEERDEKEVVVVEGREGEEEDEGVGRVVVMGKEEGVSREEEEVWVVEEGEEEMEETEAVKGAATEEKEEEEEEEEENTTARTTLGRQQQKSSSALGAMGETARTSALDDVGLQAKDTSTAEVRVSIEKAEEAGQGKANAGVTPPGALVAAEPKVSATWFSVFSIFFFLVFVFFEGSATRQCECVIWPDLVFLKEDLSQ